MDCSPPGSSVHRISQARILDWVAISFPRDLLQARDQTSIPCFGGQILYQLSHKGSPRILEWVAYLFSRGYSWPRNQTGVSCFAGGFFTNWAIREVGNKYRWGQKLCKKCVCIKRQKKHQVWAKLKPCTYWPLHSESGGGNWWRSSVHGTTETT